MGSPHAGHLERINTALESAPRRAGLPGDFVEFSRIFAAAYPVSDCRPEVTGAGKMVLYRAAPEADPWFGRGSYWTHNPAWATVWARGFELGRGDPASHLQAPPARVPYTVYRAAEAVDSGNSLGYDCGLTVERAYGYATVAMIARAWGFPVPAPPDPITQLNRKIRDQPEWPGRSWLVLDVPMEGPELGKLVPLVQYVYCGKQPVNAEQAAA